MAEALTETSKNPDHVVSSAAAAATPAESLFQRRIEFHPARKPYSPISRSGGDFHLETLNPFSSDPHGPAPPSHGGSTSATAVPSVSLGKRSDGGGFYEHGLDPELSFRITFRRIGAGLANLGNTCFLNSVLQCLTYTEPFAAYLQSGKHKSSCRTAGFCAMCALQNHVMNALQSTGKILSPSHLVKNLRCISRSFRNSRQEDAHEYMVNLLESMHKCCLPSGVPTESPGAYEKSLVHKIFGGRLRSQVKCMQCSFGSNKFDPFLDLSLEIVKADSLRKALAHFTAVEQLDGGERQYQCQRCKEKVRALKQLTVHKAPYVLTIHLKRFGPDIPGQKIDKKVEFGPTLDLKPFVSDPHEADLKYTLYGVLVHAGWSTHSGHYYCFVRTSSGMWHSLDDNQVLQVSEKTVLAQKAYMLFYVRDRSLAIKRPVDIARKDNISTTAPGNTVIPPSAPVLNGAIQNGMVERKLSISECSSAKSKADDTSHGQPVSVIGDSAVQPLCKEASSLRKNDNTIPKDTVLLQNSGLAALKEASCLQTNGKVLSKGLQQTTLSKDPTKLPSENPLTKFPLVITSTDNQKVTEDLAHPAHLKDNSVASTSRADNAPFKAESDQISYGKYQLPIGCNGKVELGILAAQPNGFGFLNPIEKHTENLRKRNSMHVNGGATNGVSQSNDTPCKMDSIRTSANNKPTKVLSQSSHMNGCIGKEPISTTLVEHQNTGPENDKCMSNLQCQKGGERLLKLEETGLIKLSKMPNSVNDCVQQQALAVTGRDNSVGNCFQTELKPKKLAKSLVKGPYFGRKQLFLTSLFLCKNKKHKRSKKRRFNSRNVIKDKAREDLNTDDQGASTSEAVRIVGAASLRSSKKRTRSSSNKANIEGVQDVKNWSDDFVHANGRNLERSSKNDVMLATSEQPGRPFSSAANQCDSRETDANGKGPVQNVVMSLLMSLKETTVARWDDMEVPSSQSHGLGDARNSNIGYVLDEWDEEYDRGKRKKVKKSKRSFGGPNPFQEIANMKLQQKMQVNQTSSGNQPLRI